MPSRGVDLKGIALRSAERRKQIVELRSKDLTFQQIADEMGLGVATVWHHYQRALRDIPAEALAEHADVRAKRRDEQLQRIDMEREAVMEVLAARHVTVSNGKVMYEDDKPILDDGPVLAAVDRLIKLDDQEARVLGIYPDQKLTLSGGVRYEVVGINASDLT